MATMTDMAAANLEFEDLPEPLQQMLQMALDDANDDSAEDLWKT